MKTTALGSSALPMSRSPWFSYCTHKHNKKAKVEYCHFHCYLEMPNIEQKCLLTEGKTSTLRILNVCSRLGGSLWLNFSVKGAFCMAI